MQSQRQDFHERIVAVSLKKYSELPKKGKPKTPEEWTPLSTFVQCEGIKSLTYEPLRVCPTPAGGELTVVSLGTGSKCIGKGKMSTEGEFTT